VPLALTGYQIGLLATALTFIAFALIVALVVPRRWPRFPGRQLWIFGIVAVLFFIGQLTAVLLLATHETETTAIEAAATTQTSTPTTTTTTPPPPPGLTPSPGGTQTTTATTTTAQTTTPVPGGGQQGNPTAGKAVFTGSAGCTGCHTLANAGSTGTVGPNLDQLKPSYARVVKQVTNGGAIMPAFKGTLTPQQIQDVAAYVSSVAGM
jgi:mono/diheme cytochrome c family protein